MREPFRTLKWKIASIVPDHKPRVGVGWGGAVGVVNADTGISVKDRLNMCGKRFVLVKDSAMD